MILSIYGPDGAELQTVTRKILKQQKNWRLNGEYIKSPDGHQKRYSLLQKDDYAVLEFTGEMEPKAARIYLVARDAGKDKPLHFALDKAYGSKFSDHRGMIELNPDELSGILSSIGLPEDHPILDFTDTDFLEDAVFGGIDGIKSLEKRRQGRGVSQEELAKARQTAVQIGRQGEELIFEWLEAKKLAGEIYDFNWDADVNAIAPYDFTILDEFGNVTRKLDVKSTAGEFRNPIHISIAELTEIVVSTMPYDLYRLYAVSENLATLRIAKDIKSFIEPIFDCFKSLPEGVSIDSVAIAPEKLLFEAEIRIDFRENDLD